MNSEKFNFVIARYWPKSIFNPYTNQLKCYSYGTTVFYGDEEQAAFMADEISERSGERYIYFRIEDKEHEMV